MEKVHAWQSAVEGHSSFGGRGSNFRVNPWPSVCGATRPSHEREQNEANQPHYPKPASAPGKQNSGENDAAHARAVARAAAPAAATPVCCLATRPRHLSPGGGQRAGTADLAYFPISDLNKQPDNLA